MIICRSSVQDAKLIICCHAVLCFCLQIDTYIWKVLFDCILRQLSCGWTWNMSWTLHIFTRHLHCERLHWNISFTHFFMRTAVTTHTVFQRCLDVGVAVKEKLLISNLRSRATSCITRLSGLWCRILINAHFFLVATVCRYCSIQHVLTEICASHELFIFTCWPNGGEDWWCLNKSKRYVCGGSYFHKCMRVIWGFFLCCFLFYHLYATWHNEMSDIYCVYLSRVVGAG